MAKNIEYLNKTYLNSVSFPKSEKLSSINPKILVKKPISVVEELHFGQ